MHVAVDGVGNHVGGGWSVLIRTVANVAEDPRVSRISVFCSPLTVVASQPATHPKVQWVEHPREHRSKRARLAWFSVGLDREVDRIQADVVLALNGAGRTSQPRICLIQQAFAVSGKLRSVRPRTFAAKLAVLRRETTRAARSANAVVVQTSWMRQRVRETLGCEASIMPLGLPAPSFHRTTPTPTHIAMIGGDLPYKRNDVARAAVTEVRQTHELELRVIEDAHPDTVAELLAASGALVIASDVESFGLPIVEAFAARCPVVLTDRPWARAVADDAAAYFAHGSASSAAQRLSELITAPKLAEELRERGRRRLDALWADEPYVRLVDLLEEVA